VTPQAISPEIFASIDEAIEALGEKGQVDEPLDFQSPVREFCRTFYEQFFANVANKRLRSISADSALEATLLLKDPKRNWPPEARKLLVRFQHLCKLDTDIRGRSYGGDEQIYREFHEEFVVELIEEIEAWAEAAGAPELAKRAAAAGPEYTKAVAEAIEEADADD